MPTRRVSRRTRKPTRKRRRLNKNAFHKWSKGRARPWLKKRRGQTGKGWFDDLLGVAAMFDPTGLVRTGVIAKTALGMGKKRRVRRRVRRLKGRPTIRKQRGSGFLSDMADTFSFVPGSDIAKMALTSVGLGKRKRK